MLIFLFFSSNVYCLSFKNICDLELSTLEDLSYLEVPTENFREYAKLNFPIATKIEESIFNHVLLFNDREYLLRIIEQSSSSIKQRKIRQLFNYLSIDHAVYLLERIVFSKKLNLFEKNIFKDIDVSKELSHLINKLGDDKNSWIGLSKILGKKF